MKDAQCRAGLALRLPPLKVRRTSFFLSFSSFDSSFSWLDISESLDFNSFISPYHNLNIKTKNFNKKTLDKNIFYNIMETT